MIGHNPGGARSLLPNRGSGAPVRLAQAASSLAEGIFIAKEINRMVGGMDMLDAGGVTGDERIQPRSFSDIAILYRTHRQADILEYCLQKENIPYTVAGRDSFLSEPAVRAAIGFFRFLLAPGDTHSLQTALELGWACSPQQAVRLSAFFSPGAAHCTKIFGTKPRLNFQSFRCVPLCAHCENFLSVPRRSLLHVFWNAGGMTRALRAANRCRS